jgi:hypothetical protein
MRDQPFLSIVQRKLLETPNGGQAYDSELWTAEEGYRYTEQAEDQLLAKTHALVSVTTIAGVIGTARYALPADWLATVACAWQVTVTGAIVELPPADTLQVDAAFPTWATTNGLPRAWADAEFPTRTLQLMPAPDAAGTLHLHYVARAIPVTGQGSVLSLPDDLVYCGVQWGVLARMLGKVGRAHDAGRAAYARQRVELCEAAVRLLLEGLG